MPASMSSGRQVLPCILLLLFRIGFAVVLVNPRHSHPRVTIRTRAWLIVDMVLASMTQLMVAHAVVSGREGSCQGSPVAAVLIALRTNASDIDGAVGIAA